MNDYLIIVQYSQLTLNNPYIYLFYPVVPESTQEDYARMWSSPVYMLNNHLLANPI